MAQIDSSLWVEKYRPISVKDMIMPKEFKSFFNKVMKSSEITNLLLSSPTPRNAVRQALLRLLYTI